ncbi:hypothetical protein QVG61_07505 [Thiohalobacter sp. IOR34]|uniref:hypothetical protein n=1 Tax=Thiohalobacter sp. IOR34 TaxID=3057176 RepID=UPI0025B1B555|nr:hypothetical protein [Thiohalobacter sp. IOR34]WJW74363.1 hypothetical protein QVG61_07505 [Thiohalobacter sp. IOR34]
MTNKDRILDSLNKHGPMCDDCLSSETKINPRQTINIACRSMAEDNLLVRSKDLCPNCRGTKIINRVRDSAGIKYREESVSGNPFPNRVEPIKNHDVEGFSEDEIKQVLGRVNTNADILHP